jgi:hypothetical protein
MMKSKHPGIICYVDGRTQRVTVRVDAKQLPLNARFAQRNGELVPVVKVIAYPKGDRRVIREYGPADELLRTTLAENSAEGGVQWWRAKSPVTSGVYGVVS